MTLHVALNHRTLYDYDRRVQMGPQTIRLRPASHTRARVERYRLEIAQDHRVHWQQDPHGNHLARISFKLGERVEIYTTNLDMTVNNYDRIYVARGERIVDAWPIMGRSGAAQR